MDETKARQVLEPCPFCGSAHVDVVMFETHHNEMWHRAECQNCMAKSSGSKYPALAIAAWNRRATDPAVAELVEVLNAILTDMPIIDCDRLHHTKEDRHGAGPCPVEMRLDAAVSRASALLAKYAASPRDAT